MGERGHRGLDGRDLAVHDHVLDHDHGVEGQGQRVAGVDEHEALARGQAHGRALAGEKGIRGAHGDAVHGRAVEGGRGIAGDDRRGRDAAGGMLRADALGANERLAVEHGLDLLQSVLDGNGAQIDIAFHDALPPVSSPYSRHSPP
ncbi:hypothetical protein DSECCO2_659940 [anaerobic digester metagenome]